MWGFWFYLNNLSMLPQSKNIFLEILIIFFLVGNLSKTYLPLKCRKSFANQRINLYNFYKLKQREFIWGEFEYCEN